ncbi:hypothetical protein BFW86_08995 [Pseudomonas fluorescens]|nr:hypothetical protein BFW86_08995 [Pseudomonas fluorescens]
MNRQVLGVLIALGTAGLFGCVGRPVESFTLEVDLPANFKLKTAANYRPATGETCTLPRRRGKRPERKVFFTDYTPVAHRLSYQLPLTETVNGCPLVLRGVEFDVYAKWGSRDWDIGGDIGNISILDRTTHSSGMPQQGVQQLLGQCQWLFRTIGPKQAIIKILKCNSLDAAGQLQRASAGGVAQRDQLAGKILRMALRLSNEEEPAFDDNWVAVPGGWKRCKGKNFEDQDAYCNGNTTDFKPIKMPDGRICEVYPSCK